VCVCIILIFAKPACRANQIVLICFFFVYIFILFLLRTGVGGGGIARVLSAYTLYVYTYIFTIIPRGIT